MSARMDAVFVISTLQSVDLSQKCLLLGKISLKMFAYMQNNSYLCTRKRNNKTLKIMTKQEFTQRIGIQCSDAVFEKYNNIYSESELDKDEFCKTISKADVAWEMQWEIIELKKQLEKMREQRNEICGYLQNAQAENKTLRQRIRQISELATA